MGLTQQTFIGASISRFNSSIGWGSQPSTLQCILVEDRKNGDSFNPPLIGKQTIFKYGNWSFNGVITKYQKTGGSSGSPIYTVDMEDPRFLLEGVQLILDSYTGSVLDIPNVLNIYGYLEQNFGGSQINNGGIPWRLIQSTIMVLTAGNTEYGASLQFQNDIYTVNLVNLPPVSSSYRIGGPSTTLMGFIDEICNAGGVDYFFGLVGREITLYTIPRNRIPEIGVISNFVSSVSGATSKNLGLELRKGVTSKIVLGADVTDMYVRNISADRAKEIADARYDGIYPYGGEYDNIYPYWGQYDNGNVVFGRTISDDEFPILPKTANDILKYKHILMGEKHTVDLDARQLDIPWVGSTYTTDINELRSVLKDQKNWEEFLLRESYNEYARDYGGDFLGYEKTIGKFITTYTEKIYKINSKEFADLKLSNNIIKVLPFQGSQYKVRLPKLSGIGLMIRLSKEGVKKAAPERCINRNTFKDWDEFITKIAKINYHGESNVSKSSDLLDYLLTYTHNGVPNIHFLKALRLGLNDVGSTSNYIADINLVYNFKALGANAAQFANIKNAAYTEITLEKDEERRKLYNFLRKYASDFLGKKFMVKIPVNTVFDSELNEVRTDYEIADAGYLDRDSINNAVSNKLLPKDSSFLRSEDGRFVPYVRYDYKDLYDMSEYNIDDYSIYNNSIFVKCQVDEKIVYVNTSTGYSPRAVITLPSKMKYKVVDESEDKHGMFLKQLTSLLIAGKISPDTAKKKSTNFVNAVKNEFGSDEAIGSIASVSIMPDAVMIPLRSKTKSYGPYVAAGAQGAVVYEKDESLNPWNYNSYELMDEVGYSKVNNAIVTQTYDESGSVTFPGTPALSLGDQLLNSGPYITSISCSIDEGGVTTTYDMKTWNSTFGNLNISEVQKFNRLLENQRKIAREIREIEKKNMANRNKGG